MNFLLITLSLIFFQGCSHVFYQPSAKHFLDPAQFKISYEDVWFKSQDGTKLHGWFFKAKTSKPKGTIVQFHGNGENISTHFYSLIWLIDQGYNLFTFDYRGYAKSEGKPSQAGIYQDALAAFDKALEYHQQNGNGKFVIYGQSTGGAISLRAIPDWKHYDKITLIVMDSAFYSYQDIAFDKLSSHWFLLPFSPLAYVLVSDKYASDEVFNRITKPVLVIVGMKDPVVPSKFGKRIYKGVASKEKWLWKLPEGAHINAFHHSEGMIYREKFVKFLDQISQ
jgi:fermentation-respiration switch protein FrsA (DUF1100 family)